MPKGITNVRKRVPEVLENATDKLPAAFRHLVERLLDHLKDSIARSANSKRRSRLGIAAVS